MHARPYVAIHVQSEAPSRRISAADLVRSIELEIQSGKLPEGLRLPPLRTLSSQLSISKNTVQAAYDELAARGLIETRSREGVFVRTTDKDASAVASQRVAAANATGLRTLAVAPRLLAPSFTQEPRPREVIGLSDVLIDPTLLPSKAMADCVRSVLHQPGLQVRYEFQGYAPLRECIAERLSHRGLDVTADEIVITAGSQQALDVVARSLELRHIAVESPVYSYALRLFESLGVRMRPLELDPFAGIDFTRWETLLRAHTPSLLYAITSFQNPTGYCYTTRELIQLLELAAELRLPLLEDDWGSDMLPDSEYRPSLRALGGKQVLYINSFTKKLWPSMRVGYVVAPRECIPSLVAAKRMATLGNAWLAEAAVYEFLDRGYYDTHLKKLQTELAARYAACIENLRALMPPSVRWTFPGGGPTLWLELPREVELDALRRHLLSRGFAGEDCRAHFLGSPHLHGFRLSYAAVAPDVLRRGLEVIGAYLSEEPRASQPLAS